MSHQNTKIAVLVSGGGTNLQAIIDKIHFGNCPAEIACVISNKTDVYALTRAAKAEIISHVIKHGDYKTRQEFEKALISTLDQHGVDIIVLAGFMRVLGKTFINAYSGKILNIHPALLPNFPGLNTHQRAIDAGVNTHGCSVHFVTEELDGGPVILQAEVEILADESAEDLAKRVLEKEHIIYPRCIEWLVDKKIMLRNQQTYYEDKLLNQPLLLED